MATAMTDDEIRAAAKALGCSFQEGKRRHDVLMAHDDDPEDPICVGCARRPHEISNYRIATKEEEVTTQVTDDEVRLYVIHNEGTLNPRNGHFLCDLCYIKNGQPSSPGGWVCP